MPPRRPAPAQQMGFAFDLPRAAPSHALSVVTRPHVELAAPASASGWPDLRAIVKHVDPATGKQSKRMVVQLSGEEFEHNGLALSQAPRGLPPTVYDLAYNGAPYVWPRVIDEPFLRLLVAMGALVVVSDSGGKDSQAQGILLSRIVPPEQLLFVHATLLGGVEWEGTLEQAQGHAQAARAPFMVVKAASSLLDRVRLRRATRPGVPSWPSPANRSCTADLKRGPIQKGVTAYAEKHGFKIIVDASGIRALESPNRG